MPKDERDEATCHHELAHVAYNDNSTLRANFIKACQAANVQNPRWIGAVSDYARKNTDERHSECAALAMSRAYKK